MLIIFNFSMNKAYAIFFLLFNVVKLQISSIYVKKRPNCYSAILKKHRTRTALETS